MVCVKKIVIDYVRFRLYKYGNCLVFLYITFQSLLKMMQEYSYIENATVWLTALEDERHAYNILTNDNFKLF